MSGKNSNDEALDSIIRAVALIASALIAVQPKGAYGSTSIEIVQRAQRFEQYLREGK